MNRPKSGILCCVLLLLRRAFVANFVPALFLWVFVGVLAALYWFHAPTTALLNELAALKLRWGLVFSVSAGAISSALLPFLFQRFQSGSHRKTLAVHLPFLMVFTGVMGVVVDKFYTFQAFVWGSGNDFQTVALKTLCDMGLFTPIFAMPMVTLAFAFKDHEFSVAKTRRFLGRNWLVERVLPLYLAALLVWVPTVFVVYSLPSALQFPFQSIVQCLWGLIVVVVTAHALPETDERAETSSQLLSESVPHPERL